MDKEVKNFLKSINYEIVDDTFTNSHISKVILNKEEEKFYVSLSNDLPCNLEEVKKLLACSKKGIKHENDVVINFIYDTIRPEDVLAVFLNILEEAKNTHPSLVTINKENVKILDQTIDVSIASKTEEDILNELKEDFLQELSTYGFNDYALNINIDSEMTDSVIKEITEEKNRPIEVVIPEDTSSSSSSYQPRKKVGYSRKGLVTIKSLVKEENNVHLEAYIFGSEFNELKTKDGRTLYLITLKISDKTSSIVAKYFAKDEKDFEEKSKELKEGNWYAFVGQVRYDSYSKDLVFNLRSYESIENEEIKREDNASEKRVELHAHTMMSQMDGVCDEVALVKMAMNFGHSGVVITDKDSCQSFPHVFNTVTSYNKDIKKKLEAKINELKTSLKENEEQGNVEAVKEITKYITETEEELKNPPYFKAGYGVELDMCESYLNVCFNANNQKIEDNTFVIFDTETTGFNPGLGDSMIEIGAVKIHNGEVIDRFDELINPGHHIDEAITKVTDISDEDVKDAPNEEEVIKKFKEWIGSLPLVAHNARFDKNMLDMAYYRYNLGLLTNPIIDTLMLSRVINRDQKRHSLKALGKYYGVDTGEEKEIGEDSEVADAIKLSDELVNAIDSIKVDGEEIIKVVESNSSSFDYENEISKNTTIKEYYLSNVRKASKTEKTNLDIKLKEGYTLTNLISEVDLHPAENIVTINYTGPFGESSFDLKIYVGQHHGADVDSENTGYIFNKMLKQIKGISTLKDLNNLGLLEEIAIKNDPKKLENITDLISYKNYIIPSDDESLAPALTNYNIKGYRFKYAPSKEDNLKMYDNIPGKTFTEHLANLYDSQKHVTIIAKNSIGLKNMFKLVSYANTNFLDRSARIPRKYIEENREGILVGSSCLNGEIFYLAETRSDEDLIKAMEFYDYIEVQPIENYLHLVTYHDINNRRHLEYCLEKIIKCAKKCGKLICATGDVHNLNKEDLISREIIVNQNVPGKGRHALAKYLTGRLAYNYNEDNILKVKNLVLEKGNSYTKIDDQIIKYIYTLKKIKHIPINLDTLMSLFIPNSEETNLKDEILKEAISSSLRKFQVLGIITLNSETNNYDLIFDFNKKSDYEEGHIPNQYFRTTDEMKEGFKFLKDEELINEIVITNPRKILDMLDIIEVIDHPPKPYSPIIENSQETVRDMVFEKAWSMYGNPLPQMIEERIAQEFYGDKILGLAEEDIKNAHPNWSEEEYKKNYSSCLHDIIMEGYDRVAGILAKRLIKDENVDEKDALEKAKASLGGIIGGGFDVIYLIAQKLIKHSNDDGYLVGSRGSVGSSFVASMMGITECNPLPAHYYCPDCAIGIFQDENGKDLVLDYPSGFDLPDKNCPKCGKKMRKDGNDMPFATFLGFNADKVPDIDLNFSGDNQPSAHEYTKVLFGTDNVYRAGTVSTVADKTAIGYVQGYFESKLFNELRLEAKTYGLQIPGLDDLKRKGIVKCFTRFAEVERLSVGCTGVKRTTGQHPGGIVVVPGYKDVFDFTAFQYPADDPTSPWRTTHFEYHAIEDDLLKLDILGHDDPTMLRLLQDLSGIDVTKIDLSDRDTMKIFLGPEVLGLKKTDLRALTKNGKKYCPTGTLGVPEFGTSFLLGMLEETKPTTFAELIKISGLSHGTDVWLGNARDLCTPDENGNRVVPFKEVIGCRDDIMVSLMKWGLKPIRAFTIMEFVRRGKPSKDPATWATYVKEMQEAGIPDWYIDSCRKIKYMFPKAHATAYVTSAFRVAWFKVHMPIYYYAAYFSIRCTQFDIASMISGPDAIRAKIDELEAKGDDASNKDKEVCSVLYSALEMAARGFYFKNIDVSESDGKYFKITEDKKGLLLPFRALDGLGDAVADAIVKARKTGPFVSKEDLRERGKINYSSLQKLEKLGCLNNLSDSNQLSLF